MHFIARSLDTDQRMSYFTIQNPNDFAAIFKLAATRWISLDAVVKKFVPFLYIG